MKRFRWFGVLAAGVAWAVLGMSSTAHADIGDDAAIIVDNLPDALDELTNGVTETVDTLITTQSAVETSAALGDALVATGAALVNGTEQFGALGLVFTVVDGGIQSTLAPYLGAIDDPSTAGDAINPDDVETVLGNLGPAVDALLHGSSDNGVLEAVAEALRGNLIAGSGFGAIGTPALVGSAINGVGTALVTLADDTSVDELALTLGILLLVGAVAGADYIQQLEDAAAPLFEAAGPVTEPLIGVVEAL